jgi:hypothetical protein
VLAALILLVGIARSGARYFHCAMMGAALAGACCAAHEAGGDDPTAKAPDCCESRKAETLPSASAASSFELELEPLVDAEVARWPARAFVPRAALTTSVTYRSRVGLSPPARRHTTMMIWNC